jgi:hypothetical protein
MNQNTIVKLSSSILLLAIIQLTGCSCTNTSNYDHSPQDRPMGQGIHQGPPPSGQHEHPGNQEPPAEAFTACIDKQLGDHVEFTDQRGELIKATCQDFNDHLVAIPEGLEKKQFDR